MMYGMLPNDQFDDISTPVRVVLVAILVLIVLALTGCGAAGPIQAVTRHPPAEAMVRMQPLPTQTDPTLGGMLSGYTYAGQQYRACTGYLTELQDYIGVSK